MTSANELAALADRLDNGLTNPDIDPCDRNNFAPPLSRSEWELIVAALRATSTAGVRDEAVGKANWWLNEIESCATKMQDGSTNTYHGHILKSVDAIRSALSSSPTNSEWNATVENPVKVINYLLAAYIDPPFTLVELVQFGVMTANPPQSIFEIRRRKLDALLPRLNLGFQT